MLDRHEWHVDPDRRRQLARPLTGTENDDLAVDSTKRCDDACYAAVDDVDALDRRLLDDRDARHSGALGECHRDVGGVRLTVGRQQSGADHVANLHHRPQFLRLASRQQMHLEPERGGGRGLPFDLLPAFGVACQAQPPIHLPTGGLPGLGLQSAVEIDRVAEQLRRAGTGSQLPHQSGRVERRPRRQLTALEEHRVGPPQVGEVIGRRAADDAPTDHHGTCRRRLVAGRSRAGGDERHGSRRYHAPDEPYPAASTPSHRREQGAEIRQL